MIGNRLQTNIATGRFTLPVVVLMCLALWLFTGDIWNNPSSLLAIAITGYLMIEANTAFTLIRRRTTFQVSIYSLLATSLFFLHPFEWANLIPILFMVIICQLFSSYESHTPSTPIFHAFLFTGIGSLLFPQFIYFAPLFIGCMIPFRSLSIKSLFAGLLGLITPFWFFFGYAFIFDKMHSFSHLLKETIHFYPIDYSLISNQEWISWGVVTLLLAIAIGNYTVVAYQDKTRIRIFLSFIAITGIWTTLFCILQPVHSHEWMQIQLVCTSFLTAHLFSLTRNRFSSICFIVIFAILILLTSYNIWMQFFSF